MWHGVLLSWDPSSSLYFCYVIIASILQDAHVPSWSWEFAILSVLQQQKGARTKEGSLPPIKDPS